MSQRTPAHRAFWQSLCELPLIPTLSVTEWARKHRVISRGHSHRPGRFDPYPMQVAPMDDLNALNVSEVILCWAAQTGGKNEIINNAIGYFIDADPSPTLLVMPTDKLAGDYSKERIAPTIRDTPVLRHKVRDPRSRDSGNTVLSKTYPGGSLVFVGANAPAGLAGRPRRVILQDEIDRYPASAGTEGDPVALADKRAEAFPNAVKLKTSTPTVKGKSRIWKKLEQSDWQKWHARCPRCQGEQVFAWSQVGWLEGEPETAWIECAHCKGKLDDEERVAAVRAGRWKATQPFHGIRGFWLNGINTLLPKHKGFKNRLHQMAAEFLAAKHDGPETLRVWTNTFLAECWEEATEAPAEAKELLSRCEDYAPDLLPLETLVLVASADVQQNRIEAFVWGFGADDEAWSVERVVFDGDPEKDDVWNALDGYLLKQFTRADGVPLKIERVFVDMGYKSRRVLSFCRPRIGRGVYPCRGVNREGPVVPPLLPAEPSRNNRMRIPHWNVGVTVAKTTVFDRLQLPAPGPRSMHFPQGHGHDEDFFRQLTAEKRKTRFTHGGAYFIFEKDNASVRNEVLDLHVYALAALESLGPIAWEKRAEYLRKLIPKKPEEAEAEAAAREVRVVRAPRSNFATRW